jgi:hypothetical protein
MPDISQIRVFIHTAEDDGAGTDSDVFLGICGREFRLDTDIDNFENFNRDVFHLNGNSGSAPLSVDALKNHPKIPQIHTDSLDKFPIYVRMEPWGEKPDWTILLYRDPTGPAFLQKLTSIQVFVDVAFFVGGQEITRKFREFVPCLTDAELKRFDPASTRQDHGVNRLVLSQQAGKYCYLRGFPT